MSIDFPENARLIGRVWRPELEGPSVVIIRDGVLFDVTREVATVADFLDGDSVATYDSLK